MEAPCLVCNYTKGLSERKIHDTVAVNKVYVDCPRCGKYYIEYGMDYESSNSVKPRQLNDKALSAFIGHTREQTIKGNKIHVTYKNFDDYVKYAVSQAPQSPSDKIDRLLYNISNLSDYPGKLITIDPQRDYPVGYCKDEIELQYYLEHLTSGDNQYLKSKDGKYGLSVQGWDRIEKLKGRNIDSIQCFVAMWFSDEMSKIYLGHISKAVKMAGYKPMIIPDVKHDNEVTSQILAEIQKSKFVIADFTGQRAGVYFEAGFAKGLGLNVIWTCEKDWFDNKEAETEGEYKIDGQWVKGIIKEERHTHFDVNHRRFIIWEDSSEDNLIKFENDIYNSIIEQFGEGPLNNNEPQTSK